MRKITKNMSVETFGSFYFTVKELKDFCQNVGIKIGSHYRKEDLTKAIKSYLTTKAKDVLSQGKTKVDELNKSERKLSSNSLLGKGFKFTRKTRNYFEKNFDEKFKLNVTLLAWVKASPNKTIADFKKKYLELKENKNKKKPLGKQFEFNQFTRDFFKANPNLSRQNCLHCWSFVRELKNRTYSKAHLNYLKKEK